MNKTAQSQFLKEPRFVAALKNAIESQTPYKLPARPKLSGGGFAGDSHWGLSYIPHGYTIAEAGDYNFSVDVVDLKGQTVTFQFRVDDWTICLNDKPVKTWVKISNENSFYKPSPVFLFGITSLSWTMPLQALHP